MSLTRDEVTAAKTLLHDRVVWWEEARYEEGDAILVAHLADGMHTVFASLMDAVLWFANSPLYYDWKEVAVETVESETLAKSVTVTKTEKVVKIPGKASFNFPSPDRDLVV